MTFEEIEIETLNGFQKHIVLDLGNGNFKSFPADEANPEYVAWAVAEGIMEAPVVVEPEDTEPVTEPEPDTE